MEGWEEQPTDSCRGLLEPGGGGGELEFIAQAAGCRHLAGLDGLAFQSRGWEWSYYCINSLDSLKTIASLTPSSVALLCL